MCFWYPPFQKTKKLQSFSNAYFFEKKDGPSPHEKCHFLLDVLFSQKTWPTHLQISHKEMCASYLLNDVKGYWSFLNELPTLRVLQSVAVLRLCVGLADADNMGAGWFWYLSADKKCTFLHAKFEIGSSILVLRKGPLFTKKSGV
jgi:hypothetical protein